MLRMRFGSFVWPNNPRTYTISCKRQTAVHKVPMGGFVVQDLGRTATVMKGEGEFFGADAYLIFWNCLFVSVLRLRSFVPAERPEPCVFWCAGK